MLIPPPMIKPTIYVSLSNSIPYGLGFWSAVANFEAMYGPVDVVFGEMPEWMSSWMI